MKLNVKIGDIYARVEATDCDKKTRLAIVKHVESCPQCIAMIYKRGKKRA